MAKNRSGKHSAIIRRPADIRQTCYPRLSNPKGMAEFRRGLPAHMMALTRGRVKDSHE